MKILLVTDAWRPQVNGVVRTLETIQKKLTERGHWVEVIHPDPEVFNTVPCPKYPEVPLAILPYRQVKAKIEEFDPHAIHVATEGPLGWAARNYCVRHSFPFTTAYHTQFPEYLKSLVGMPLGITYKYVKAFHNKAQRTFTNTPGMHDLLTSKGFKNLKMWTRGVDTELFHPSRRKPMPHKGPILLYVGRVSKEKNLEAFLDLDYPGTKVVVGFGPMWQEYRKKYPKVVFTGAKFGTELAQYFASADAFVFPSRTDTFGLVMLEAMAAGTPVAAYPVTGPIDVIKDPKAGCLHENLRTAIDKALLLNREDCRAYAENFSWDKSVEQFLTYLCPVSYFAVDKSTTLPKAGPLSRPLLKS